MSEERSMKPKTVYILGAGASKTANLPMQTEILPLVFSLDNANVNMNGLLEGDFLSLTLNERIQRLKESYQTFDEYRQDLGGFILNSFAPGEKARRYSAAIYEVRKLQGLSQELEKKKKEKLFEAYDMVKNINVTLEDLFTIFDNVAANREHFRLYSPKAMGDIHRKLKMCIIYALSCAISMDCNPQVYNKFSEYLLAERANSRFKEDSVSLITMNWDDLLESALYEVCLRYNSEMKNKKKCIYPDLCFYDYSVEKDDKHIPSINIKAKGHKNIKVLKMHGSLAWLECPRCGRMYVDFTNEIAADEFIERICPYCQEGTLLGGAPVLRSLIITPTFMKSLDNLNVKNIWHNAFIEVNEASHIVFIGYSCPDADFEMRCLLKKAIRDDVKVTVVLHSSDNPEFYLNEFMSKGYDGEEAKRLAQKMLLPEERYKTFFGEDKVSFVYEGFEKYVDRLGGVTE